MPRALEQAASSSSDMADRSNSFRGNRALRLWTCDSQDGAPDPPTADFAESTDAGFRVCGPCAACGLAAGGLGVVLDGLRTPAREPGRRSLPLTMACFRPALWSRAARPTTLAFFVRRMEAECIGLAPAYSPMRMVKSWMTGFVSSRRHIFSTSAFAFALSLVLSWMSHVFVVWTPVTPSKPRRCSALAVFWPSGSEMPGFRWTMTWAVTMALCLPGADEPGRLFGVGFARVQLSRKGQLAARHRGNVARKADLREVVYRLTPPLKAKAAQLSLLLSE